MLETYFDNAAFVKELRSISDETKKELDLLDELRKLAEQLLEAASSVQTDMLGVKNALGGVLVRIREAIVGSSTTTTIGVTGHEFK